MFVKRNFDVIKMHGTMIKKKFICFRIATNLALETAKTLKL